MRKNRPHSSNSVIKFGNQLAFKVTDEVTFIQTNCVLEMSEMFRTFVVLSIIFSYRLALVFGKNTLKDLRRQYNMEECNFFFSQ